MPAATSQASKMAGSIQTLIHTRATWQGALSCCCIEAQAAQQWSTYPFTPGHSHSEGSSWMRSAIPLLPGYLGSAGTRHWSVPGGSPLWRIWQMRRTFPQELGMIHTWWLPMRESFPMLPGCHTVPLGFPLQLHYHGGNAGPFCLYPMFPCFCREVARAMCI